MKPAPFPWETVMRFGLGVLRLAPSDFWQATPREIAAAMRGHSGDSADPFSRAALEGLLLRFPD